MSDREDASLSNEEISLCMAQLHRLSDRTFEDLISEFCELHDMREGDRGGWEYPTPTILFGDQEEGYNRWTPQEARGSFEDIYREWHSGREPSVLFEGEQCCDRCRETGERETEDRSERDEGDDRQWM